MISRHLKLKLNRSQEEKLNSWIPILTSIYNFGIRKIELNLKDRVHFSKFEFQNLLAGHSKKLEIPSHTIQSILLQSYNAWDRHFKNIGRKPKLKSTRNKLRSIPFPDSIPSSRITKNSIKIPGIGLVRYYKQNIPEGKIKQVRVVKKASGWYCAVLIDANNYFKVKDSSEKVGIDTGFKSLVTLSNGIKIPNQRNLIKGQKRIVQSQRGKRAKLTARLNERIANRRKDYNHKLSRKLIEDYSEIYITNDNLKSQAKRFGKSVADAGISQLRTFIVYKGDNHGRKVTLVDSKYTTMTCGDCMSKTGPSGLNGLAVRIWECAACGAVLDRDVNSANVILKFGLGCSLVSEVVNTKSGLNRNPSLLENRSIMRRYLR